VIVRPLVAFADIYEIEFLAGVESQLHFAKVQSPEVSFRVIDDWQKSLSVFR